LRVHICASVGVGSASVFDPQLPLYVRVTAFGFDKVPTDVPASAVAGCAWPSYTNVPPVTVTLDAAWLIVTVPGT